MNMIRKAVSALRLAGSVDKWPELGKRFGENVRDLRLRVHGRAPFFYIHRNGFPYVVLDGVAETRATYIRGQSYEKTEAALMNAWLSAGDQALDCGANVGLFSALMASRVGPKGRVVSIEASPTTYKCLSLVKNVLALQNVETLDVCLANKKGETYFSDDPSFSEANSILGDNQGGIRVQTTSIDDLLDELEVNPALVKLDIEGAEPLAFRGWQALWKCDNPPLLIFEVFPRGLSRLGFSPADIFKSMPVSRFEFWHINFSWPNPAPEFPAGVPFQLPDPLQHVWPTHTNVVAIPKDGAFGARRSRLKEILPLRS